MKFSAALCRGLIEARRRWLPGTLHRPMFSAALCRGLIEAGGCHRMRRWWSWSFPRLYAAASLKLLRDRTITAGCPCFPRLYAAASLKRVVQGVHAARTEGVFRGFMPRPH